MVEVRLGLIFFLWMMSAAGGLTPSAAAAPEVAIAPGESAKIVMDEKAGAFRRSYVLHVPKGYDGEPRPLVVALHGGVATARILEKQTAFSALADEHGFFVVYPNGMGIFSLLRHWNGGFCCARAAEIGLDDVGFIDRVRGEVTAKYAIDPDRIYVVGYSNGGFLAYWYAAVRADQLAALGIWASSIGSFRSPERSWTMARPVAPLPTFIAHGLDDKRLPFEASGGRGFQVLLGAVGSAEFWRDVNGCSEPPVVTEDGAVERREWCADGAAPVTLMAIDGWGHEWPGPKRTAKKPPDDPLHDFHLAWEMWTFFSAL